MGKFIDMTGWVMSEHGVPNSRITVLSRAPDLIKKDGKHETAWWCQCSCGSDPFVGLGYNIKNGNTNSCGCYKRDRGFEANHKTNDYDYSREYGVGFAINTGTEFYFDWEDFDKIKGYCWYENVNKGYHSLESRDHKNNSKLIRMHYLLGFKGYDHIDRNALNNRKSNLRPATAQENARNQTISRRNTSGVIGVGYYKPGNKWRAYINDDDGNFISLGYYIDKQDAIIARLKAEIEYYKEFAPQKHLLEEYGITVQN